MVAERIQFNAFSPTRSQTLMALFAREEEVEAFLACLNEVGLESGATTVIGVALGEPLKRLPLPPLGKSPHSTRYTLLGVGLGGGVTMLVSLALYWGNFLHLSLLEAILIHTLALVILGGVIGGAIGAIYASAQAQKMMTTLPPQNTEGFLVTLKLAAHLIPQGETLAHQFGAKKVIV